MEDVDSLGLVVVGLQCQRSRAEVPALVKEVVREGWDLQKDSDSLEPGVVDLQGQQLYVEVRKTYEELG